MSRRIVVTVQFRAQVEGSEWIAKQDEQFVMERKHFDSLSFAEVLDETMHRVIEMADSADNAGWVSPEQIPRSFERAGGDDG